MPNQRRDGITPRTITLPDALWRRIVTLAGRRGASQYIREATEARVEQDERAAAQQGR